MADVLFVAIVFGFFGLMVALVKACDVIIGPDPLGLDQPAPDEPARDEAADARPSVAR